MAIQRTVVAVIDDDESVREWLPDLLGLLGFEATVFASAEEFLAGNGRPHPGCLILDVELPGMSGPDLRDELMRRGHDIPTIFITARGKNCLPPGARQPGVKCLFKPFGERELREALHAALL